MGQLEDRVHLLERKMEICLKYLTDPDYGSREAKEAIFNLTNPPSSWHVFVFRRPENDGIYLCDMGSRTYVLGHWKSGQWLNLVNPQKWMEIPE